MSVCLHIYLSISLSILYYTILYYTILYYTTLHYTTLHYTILYYTILYYTIPNHTILYYTILYYTIPYHTIPYPYYTILYYTILYCIYYTILYYTIQSHTDTLIHRERERSCGSSCLQGSGFLDERPVFGKNSCENGGLRLQKLGIPGWAVGSQSLGCGGKLESFGMQGCRFQDFKLRLIRVWLRFWM